MKTKMVDTEKISDAELGYLETHCYDSKKEYSRYEDDEGEYYKAKDVQTAKDAILSSPKLNLKKGMSDYMRGVIIRLVEDGGMLQQDEDDLYIISTSLMYRVVYLPTKTGWVWVRLPEVRDAGNLDMVEAYPEIKEIVLLSDGEIDWDAPVRYTEQQLEI